MGLPLFLYDLIRVLAMRSKRLGAARHASRSEILALQKKRLLHLLEHAARFSPFYRRRWAGNVPGPEDLSSLEPVSKTQLIDHYNEVLAVKDLDLASVRRWMAGTAVNLPNRYVLAATSGTTGQPVVIPYTRREWREGMTYIVRSSELTMEEVWGRRGGLVSLIRERPRVAGISTLNPIHVSAQLTRSFRTGLVANLLLSAAEPLEQQIDRLNRFQPTVLGGYPSAIGPLSRAALDGALKIQPRLIVTGGETVSGAVRRNVSRAWGLNLFDFYGLAETLIIAGECLAHQGLHIYEDAVVLEVVDEKGRVLPSGESGDKVLLTNLFNRTLPLIRYEVSDMLTVNHEPCPCGLCFSRIMHLEGRREELLELRSPDGQTVMVHPFVVESPLEEMPEIRQFQISDDSRGGLRIVIVPYEQGSDPADRAKQAVDSVLVPLGVGRDAVQVQSAASIKSRRGPTDKIMRG